MLIVQTYDNYDFRLRKFSSNKLFFILGVNKVLKFFKSKGQPVYNYYLVKNFA